MSSLKRRISSRASKPRTAWFPIVTKVGDEYSFDIGWRYYDGSVGFFSIVPKSFAKTPWGEVVSCEFNRTKNSKSGEVADYFKFQNRVGQKYNFKADLMNPMIFGVNDFTQKVAALRAGGKVELLGKFFGLLSRGKGFTHHNQELHSEAGLRKDDDGVLLGGDSEVKDLEDFVKAAKEAAIIVENKEDALSHLKSTKKVKPSAAASGVIIKQSKAQKVTEDKNKELEDKNGLERSYVDSFVGRTDILLDNLSVSDKSCIPINLIKVLGIANSMQKQFDPSLLNLTVYPEDDKNFDRNHLENSRYKIIHGNHRFKALQHLDRKGILTSLPGLQDRTVTCYVVNVQNSAAVAYGNLRGNDLASKFQRKPYVHELLFIFDSLQKVYHPNKEKALEMIIRFAKLLAIHPDEITALKKLSSWKPESFLTLISVLKQFEIYETADCKDMMSRNNGKLMRGEKLAVSKLMFKGISKCDQDYFKANSDKILNKKLSLKSLLDNVGKDLGKKKTIKNISALTNFQSVEKLRVQCPGKFDDDVIEKFVGAEIQGQAANLQGKLLENYCKSVLSNEMLEPIKIEYIENLSDVSKETFEGFEIVLLNLKEFGVGASMAIVDVALESSKPVMSVLLLFRDEDHSVEAVKFLSTLSKPSGFVVKQVFFETDKPKLKNGFLVNTIFGILLGKVNVFDPPLKILNGTLEKNLPKFIRKISPVSAKIAFVNDGNLPITRIHDEEDGNSVVYFGSHQAVNLFLNQAFPVPQSNLLDDSGFQVSANLSPGPRPHVPCYAPDNPESRLHTSGTDPFNIEMLKIEEKLDEADSTDDEEIVKNVDEN
eukprot:GFUD01139602.1.p1 GENE.GFUD01139602.1~~GFUD01139602.1.p1  ORF type:complete len:825 (+),score=170.44 GFUD01139602.1:57-2531(+)